MQWDSENRVDDGEFDFVDDGLQRPFQNISALLGKRLSTLTRTYAEES